MPYVPLITSPAPAPFSSDPHYMYRSDPDLVVCHRNDTKEMLSQVEKAYSGMTANHL